MQRIDDLQVKGLKIIQDTALFRFGTDAVLLADFTRVPKGARVVDLGTGTGILPLLLYARQENARYFAVEIQEELCALARRSVEMNGLCGAIEIVRGDLREAARFFGGANDVVVANPPYEKAGAGAARGGESHRIARKEVCATLNDVCASAAALLKTGGRFCMVHRASRLPELFAALGARGLEPKALRLVHARVTREPGYALIEAVKGGGSFLRVLPPLVLYGENGGETAELKRIYHKEEGV